MSPQRSAEHRLVERFADADVLCDHPHQRRLVPVCGDDGFKVPANFLNLVGRELVAAAVLLLLNSRWSETLKQQDDSTFFSNGHSCSTAPFKMRRKSLATPQICEEVKRQTSF